MFPIDFCHIPVSIIKRSAGRSAVAAAAYRSGTKLTNEWDGMTHDYTRKGGIVHAEIMLPAYAPPEFADRSILWNSVEQIEKARDSQLAREIEAALPRELSDEQQLARVKPEKRELFEQRHSRELILYDAAARYLKELKDSGEEITPKAWQREIDLLTAQKQVDTIDMKAMREELKAVERLRKAADQLARQERDKPHDRGPER